MSPDTADALSVHNLELAYRWRGRDLLVLRDVSLRIAPAESYGLVGESGSGKTSVALAIARYLPPNARVVRGRILSADAMCSRSAARSCAGCAPRPSRWSIRIPRVR